MENISLTDALDSITALEGLRESEKDQVILALGRGVNKEELVKLARDLNDSRKNLNALAKQAIDLKETLQRVESAIIAAQALDQAASQALEEKSFKWLRERPREPVDHIRQYEKQQREAQEAY